MKKLLENAKGMLVGGHRGCSCEYPENSIAAMQEGIRRGAAYLEIDVQLTKDEVPVIYHDTELSRRSNLSGYVHDATLAQMREAIPGLCTLREAMEWGSGQGAYFGLELKTVPLDMQRENMKLAGLISRILKETQMVQQVFVFGQDYQVLRHLRAVDAKVNIGLIVPFVPADPVKLMQEMDAIIYLSYIYNMTPQMIEELHEHGYYVDGAILRDEKWIRRAVELGVDMFESDTPSIDIPGRNW